MGKSIYLSDYELELLAIVFDIGNYSCEGDVEEDLKMEAAEKIRNKSRKALREI